MAGAIEVSYRQRLCPRTRSEVIFPIDGMRGSVVEVGYAMPVARLFLWLASVWPRHGPVHLVHLAGASQMHQMHQPNAPNALVTGAHFQCFPGRRVSRKVTRPWPASQPSIDHSLTHSPGWSLTHSLSRSRAGGDGRTDPGCRAASERVSLRRLRWLRCFRRQSRRKSGACAVVDGKRIVASRRFHHAHGQHAANPKHE